MPTDISVQVAVIGAGPGGYAAAFYAADLGMSVALIDPDTNPGGVCLYRGCIPSKALLHAAKVITESREAAAFGVSFASPKVDLSQLRSWKDAVVGKLTGGLGQMTKMRKIAYVRGWAAFADARTLDVKLVEGDRQKIAFEHAIIATGSLPSKVPGLSIDSPRVMDSSAALDIQDVPRKLLVIGGGYIGLELGTVYAALGSDVTVVEMTAGLLPGVDRDLVGILARRAEKTFKAILLNTKVASLAEDKKGITVTLEGESVADREQSFDKVLISVGRRPNPNIDGLDRLNVKVTPRGFIETDMARRTGEQTIFAIGDVAGEPMLAHKASHEARVAVDAVAGKNVAFEPNAIPAVVFTDPEIAWCGLTETEAQQRNIKIEVARFPWAAIGRAITLDRPDGSTKLVVDPESRRVLGVGMVGAGAGELISEGVLAIEMGALVDDVAMTIHPHPTLSETVMEAAEVFFGHSTHVYRPKRKG